MTKVFQREAYFIKAADIPKRTINEVIKANTLRFYEDKACQRCEWYEDRMAHEDKHLGECDGCSAYKGGTQLSYKKKLGKSKKEYLVMPIGDREAVTKYVDNPKFVNKHPDNPMRKRIKFTGELRPEQRDAVKAIKKKKRGVVKLPPRAGKTVLSTAAICELGQKTLILAAQRDWLVGFYETFCGSKTQKPLTNANPKRVGFCKSLADFEKYDVCLVTYQLFIREKGQLLLKKLRDTFPVMFVDEVHGAAASSYASVISKFNCQYKIGLSGTPTRKDQKHVIMHKLMGPIIFTTQLKRLKPTVRLVRTDYKGKGGASWTSMVSGLEKNPKRLKLIAQWAIKDVKDGHMVLIPFNRVAVIRALVQTINKLAGKDIAASFYGGLRKNIRDQVIEDARKYKIKVVVGNTKLLSTGINIPRASCLYDVTMSSNLENAIQRTSRILTPWDDKPQPMIRYFLDDMNVRRSCLSNEWWKCVWPVFKPVISPKDLQVLKGYLSERKSQQRWEV